MTAGSSKRNHGDDVKKITVPFGIRMVVMYSILVAIGIGPSGLALLFKDSSMEGIVVGAIISIITFSLVAVVYGLLKMKLWAYQLAKKVYVAVIIFEFIRLAANLSLENIIVQGLSLGIAVWILLYLRKEMIEKVSNA